MNDSFKYIVTLWILCLPGSLHAQGEIDLLEKTWQVGYTEKNVQQHLTEYVLPGQSVEDWYELVTRQIFSDPNSRIPLSRLVEAIQKGFGPDCKNFNWTFVKQTESEVLYSWSHSGCSSYPAQAERSLITRVPKGLCRWAYVTKMPPLSASTESEVDVDLAKQSCE